MLPFSNSASRIFKCTMDLFTSGHENQNSRWSREPSRRTRERDPLRPRLLRVLLKTCLAWLAQNRATHQVSSIHVVSKTADCPQTFQSRQLFSGRDFCS